MATFSNSSIAEWLRVDGVYLPPILPCQYVNTSGSGEPVLTPASCAGVCNDSVSLFWPPTKDPPTNNLVTCGLWTTLMARYTYLDYENELHFDSANDPSDMLKGFEGTGLNETDIEYLPGYADTISNCLELIYINVKEFTFADDQRIATACTRVDLFPLAGNEVSNQTTKDYIFKPTLDSLKDCLEATCDSLTLNPDLAGIGVFLSFILQSGIAIVAFLTLFGLELWSVYTARSKKASKDKVHETETHSDRITIALTEFHKAQCYFSSVIQVTALSLFLEGKKAKNASAYSNPAQTHRDYFDTSVLIVLATGGLIPINLTLACLTRYGRHSWYLLFLSLITSVLASATLASSYYFSNTGGTTDGLYNNNERLPFDIYNGYGASNLGQCDFKPIDEINSLVSSLCGNENLLRNAVPDGVVSNWWTWLVWTNCILWLVFCFGYKCLDAFALGPRKDRIFTSIVAYVRRSRLTSFLVREYRAHTIWIATAVIPWCLCFASQFWLFSAYFRHSVISYEWSFGQIIAITVWIPCLVEYLYIEWNGIEKASFYKYPFPLTVVRLLRRSSSALTTMKSPRSYRDDRNTEAAGTLIGHPDHIA